MIQTNQSTEPIISVHHLAATFDDREILKDISFEIYPGETTVILGSSGCGKTTVLKHLIGLYPVQKGDVTVMGFRLARAGEDELEAMARKMGVLFQNGALLNSLTVAENVAIPLEQHTRLSMDIIEYLVRVKLQVVELAQAYDLLPSQLSGGMRKRAALARALALDPPLLFCDEPSAGLDPVTLASLDRLFMKLKQNLGITIVMVTHEIPSILRLADRIIFLGEGTVLFTGTLPEALKCTIPPVQKFFKEGLVADQR